MSQLGPIHGLTPKNCYDELQRMVEVCCVSAEGEARRLERRTRRRQREEEKISLTQQRDVEKERGVTSATMSDRTRGRMLTEAAPDQSYVLVPKDTRRKVHVFEDLPKVRLGDSDLEWAKSPLNAQALSPVIPSSSPLRCVSTSLSGTPFENHSNLSSKMTTEYSTTAKSSTSVQVKKVDVKINGKEAEFGIELTFTTGRNSDTYRQPMRVAVEGETVKRIHVNGRLFEAPPHDASRNPGKRALHASGNEGMFDFKFWCAKSGEMHKVALKAVVEGERVKRLCINGQLFECVADSMILWAVSPCRPASWTTTSQISQSSREKN